MTSERNSCDNLFEDYYFENSNSSSFQECPSSEHDMVEVVDTTNNKEKPTNQQKKFNSQSIPVPNVAVPEKIVLFIDNSYDKSIGYSFIDLEPNTKEPSPNDIRNEALRVFITNKISIAKDTEFAIATQDQGKLKWLSQFSSDVQQLIKSLSEIKSLLEEEPDFDVASIFSSLLSMVNIPEQTKPKIIPPKYVIRVILIYGNSYIEPKISTTDESFVKFMKSPFCILDVIYLHEKQSDCNSVEQIFKMLGTIISPGSYLLESARNVTNVFNSLAKLLAHPYQRVDQQIWNF